MLDDHKRNLEGSNSRDIFKRMHKTVNKDFWAIDLDFVLVDKGAGGRIVAILDYKKKRDRVTFAEVLAYNSLLAIAPIYVIQGDDPENGPFTVFKYLSGEWRPNPPKVRLEAITELGDWSEFESWEASLRQKGK